MAREENASYEGNGKRTPVDIKKMMERLIEVEKSILDARSEISDITNQLRNTSGLFGNPGALRINSEVKDPLSMEGSQIVLCGMGGNTGETPFFDAYNNRIRIVGNLGTEFLHVYNFESDGVYLDGRKITN